MVRTDKDQEAQFLKNHRRLTEAYLNAPTGQQKEAIAQVLEEIRRDKQAIDRGSNSSPTRVSENAGHQELNGTCEKHGTFIGPRCMRCTDQYLLHLAKDLESSEGGAG
jgi:hypothetical protein